MNTSQVFLHSFVTWLEVEEVERLSYEEFSKLFHVEFLISGNSIEILNAAVFIYLKFYLTYASKLNTVLIRDEILICLQLYQSLIRV